jgi:hypothetical protein
MGDRMKFLFLPILSHRHLFLLYCTTIATLTDSNSTTYLFVNDTLHYNERNNFRKRQYGSSNRKEF